MNRKMISAAVLAAFMLGGCSEGGNVSEDSRVVSVPTAESVPSNPASPVVSEGGAPTVIAPNFLGSSAAGSAHKTPEESYDTSIEPPSVTSIHLGETMHFSEDTVIYGETLENNETLVIDEGVKVVVENGGEINNFGVIEVNGELVLEDGRLIMGDESAKVTGSGFVTVGESFEQIDCTQGSFLCAINPPERVVENGVTTVGGIVIANKAIKLTPEFGSHLSLDEVEPEVYEALHEMNSVSEHEYVNKSGYRSYYDQQAIFQNYCDMYGYEEADTFSSQAGHSEHQTGLTMDLDDFEESYGDTPEGIWLAANCYKFGFIIRYPKGKENITGYTYEPWHVRYLGKSTAKLVHDSGLTLEEFLNVEGGTEVID